MKSIYEKENLEKIVKDCYSYSDVIIKLGKRPAGGNFKTIQNFIKKYNINISHFDGGRTKRIDSQTILLEDILTNKVYLSSSHLREKINKKWIEGK